MWASRRLLFRAFASCLLWVLLVAAAPAAEAGTSEQAIAELAQKILAVTGAHPALSLSTKNVSSLGAMEAAQLTHALEMNLSAHGAHLIATAPADVEVHVTLSENLQNFLWVAEVRRGETRDVLIVAFPRSENAHQENAPAPQLAAKLIWTQPDLFLDFALLRFPADKPPRLLILESGRLALYGSEQGRWQMKESHAIEHIGTWPRDLRGRLSLSSVNSVMELYLPGAYCGRRMSDEINIDCRVIPLVEDWPLYAAGEQRGSARFAAAKNYFEGPATLYGDEERNVPAFYSAAGIVLDDDSTIWILSGLDGKTRIYGKAPEPLAEWSGWGSDIVSVVTNCGSGRQVLATRPGDWTERDAIQAYEIIDRQPVPVGNIVSFAGAVTALWPAADGMTANAVVKNLNTKQYEAFTISFSCAH